MLRPHITDMFILWFDLKKALSCYKLSRGEKRAKVVPGRSVIFGSCGGRSGPF